jgi:hypothetical protein
MSDDTYANEDGNVVYLFGLIGAGMLLGTGIVGLYYSFGFDAGQESFRTPMNSNLTEVGFSGLDNIGLLTAGEFSIGLVFAGILAMVILNRTAWKSTGGY